MDILEPELVWVDGRCYRYCDKLPEVGDGELPVYEEETYDPDCTNSNDEFEGESIEIVPFKGNRWKHSFHVNSHFYVYIIGSKGITLKRLSKETNTQIRVPKIGENGDVVITGYNRKDIMEARYRINILIETSRSKLAFTHFVGIPTNSETIKENFIKFKNDVLSNSPKGAREITEEIFQKPEKLHLTIVMLVVLDEEERKIVTNALKNCHKIIKPILEKNGPITIEFRGLEYMNDDPSETRVLYIQPHDETGCLQEIADKIADYFIDQGLTRRQYKQVTLHVTAMSAKYGNIDTFDATNILKNHKNTYFGKMNLSTIHISQRHTISADGYYEATAEMNLTNS